MPTKLQTRTTVLREALQRAQAMVMNSQREGTLRAEMMAAEVAQAQQVAIGQQEAFRQRRSMSSSCMYRGWLRPRWVL